MRSSISYVDWSNPGKPNLLLLHGWQDHGNAWDFVAPYLRDQFNMVALDLRGHGDSDWDPTGLYGGDHFLIDALNLCTSLNWEKTHIISHSGAGIIGLFLAAFYPALISSLTLIEPALIFRRRGQSEAPLFLRNFLELRRLERERIEFSSIDAAIQNRAQAAPYIPEKIRSYIVSHNLKSLKNGKLTWKSDPKVNQGRAIFGRLNLHSVKQKELFYSKLECPVMVIKGERSQFGEPDENHSVKHLKQGFLATIPEAHHHPHHENLEETAQTLLRFQNSIHV
jgi:pimeloyl-ACP methyl ester carboxylesterase